MSSTYAIRQMEHYFKSLDNSRYYYKECAINARSPENEADPTEKTFLEGLSKDPKLVKHSEIRTLNGQPFLVIMRRGEELETSCLRCHSTPDRAPGNLVKLYGPTRSFGRQMGEVVQAISIRIPLAEAYGQANRLSLELSGILLALLGCLFASQTWISKRWLFDPIAAMRHKALEIADSEARLGETIPVPPSPELRDLTTAFNTMSRNLRLSYDSLEERVHQRIADLNQLNERLEQDIRQRQQAEEALAEEAIRRRLLVEQSRDGIVVLDQTGKVFEANQRFAEMLGYSAEEARELYLWDWDAQWTREELLEQIRLVDATGDHFETRHRRRDGTFVDVEISTNGVVLGGQKLVFCVCRDISGRKAAEQALRESEEKLNVVLETTPAGVFLVNCEGRITYANQMMGVLFARRRDELPGTGYLDLLHPEERSIGNARMMSLMAGELDCVSLERRYLGADGRDFWGHLSGRRLLRADGSLMGLVGIIMDITDRKQAEEEKAALEAKLVQAQKMEAIGTLAGGIAHDFNNILWAIMGFTELTLNSLTEGSNAHQNLQQVLKASERAKDLVNQILTFSRKTDQERKPLQIALIVKEALKLLRATIPTTIEIKQDISSPEARVLADPTQMQQLIMNLSTNSAYAMREKGGILAVRLEEQHLKKEDLLLYDDLSPGPYVILTVSDTGHGVSPEYLDRIFDPFFTTKEVGEGTGMGLSVVYGIVKSHGGGITVTSQPEAGASFTIVLPKIDSPDGEVKDLIASVPRGHGRLLVIDDEKILVDVIKKMLESLGYEVIAANSSLEALRIFQAQPDNFDLIITDQTMPHMTGMQLTQEVRQIRPDIPIILCTGFSDKVSEEIVQAAGINKLLMKPITLHNLGESVGKALDQKDL